MVCHPLLATVRASDWGQSSWTCKRIPPQEALEYTIARCQLLQEPAYDLSILDLQWLRGESRGLLVDWISSKGMALEHAACAVVDPRIKRVYPLDMITSRHAKPHLVVILYTKKRIARTDFPVAIGYANEIHGVCVEQYAMNTTTVVVNIFFKSECRSDGFGIAGISRPSPSWPTRRRRSQPSSESGVAARRLLPTSEEHA